MATNIVDGGATPGVPGVVSQNFSNLTPTFLGNYPTNPGGTFDFVSFAYNDSGDRFDIAMDFSGLSLGYLPAGTLISLLDVDIQEFMTDFQAYAPGMSPITTPWLSSPLPLGTGTIDYNLTGGDSLNSFILAGVTWLGNGYDVLGNPANQDSAFQGFRTTQDISKLRWHGGRAIGAVQPGGGGYGVAIMAGAVPEPGTLAIIGLGITGMVRRRRGGRR